MNYDNLHELINRYEANLEMLYSAEHDELFKWRAMHTWQAEWTKPQDAFTSFAERYTAAKRDFFLFSDNSRIHPSSGVLKLWEKEPATVEKLFNETLLGECESVAEIQDHMDRFLDEYEQLRQKYFPSSWSYKMDRHAASVFLAVNKPDVNYVFKSTEAHRMAAYAEFGLEIGSGRSFRLPNYYKLCDEIVEALKEHESLLEKHFARLTDDYYADHSLHLLAFDLMYCCNTYNFYKGLTKPVTQKPARKPNRSRVSAEEAAMLEAERLEKISALESEIAELEQQCAECEEISLLDVQVTSEQYGVGTVIRQNADMITVRFPEMEKSFVLNKKFKARPTFENDEDVVAIFTEYAAAKDKLRTLYRNLERLR